MCGPMTTTPKLTNEANDLMSATRGLIDTTRILPNEPNSPRAVGAEHYVVKRSHQTRAAMIVGYFAERTQFSTKLNALMIL
jgi:hypothetical protein